MAHSAHGSVAARIGVNSVGLGQVLEHNLIARGGCKWLDWIDARWVNRESSWFVEKRWRDECINWMYGVTGGGAFTYHELRAQASSRGGDLGPRAHAWEGMCGAAMTNQD